MEKSKTIKNLLSNFYNIEDNTNHVLLEIKEIKKQLIEIEKNDEYFKTYNNIENYNNVFNNEEIIKILTKELNYLITRFIENTSSDYEVIKNKSIKKVKI